MTPPPSEPDLTTPNNAAGPDDPADCDSPDCDGAVEALYGYLDGHLDNDRRQLITAHLDDCSPCFKAFGFETELRNVLAAKCRDSVPATLRAKIADALTSESG